VTFSRATILGLIASPLLLMMYILGRRPRWRPEDMRIGQWHVCAASANCDELVRPLEIMCPAHWALVPVPVRMALRKEQRHPKSYQSWLKLANKAVDWRARA